MNIRQLIIRHFRGLDNLEIKPKGHVVLVGEPGVGRSDVVEALSRVLDADAIRTRATTELDFHRGNTDEPIEIEVVVAGLGSDLEQHFLDHLEVWGLVSDQLVEEAESPEELTEEGHEWVLRLAYFGQWVSDQERCEDWVYYPKHSDVASRSFRRVILTDIEQIGFTGLRWTSGKILDLGARGAFRKIIERSSGSDFATAVAQYVRDVATAAGQFTGSEQVKEALEGIIGSLREVLRIEGIDISQLIQFAPEGGSVSGLLRSLGPAIDLGDGIGSLPAWRRGSTIGALFRLAESLSLSSGAQNILTIDDLGDDMDSASATHFAAVLKRSAGQVWITTRLPSVAEIFEPVEVIRLGRRADGTRFVCQGHVPTTRSEAIIVKHWHRNLLPVLSYHSTIVVEGPHDLATLHSLSIRLSKERDYPLPATHGVAIISAGATGSGGYASVMRLAAYAREMGLCAVGVVDGDTSSECREFLEQHTNDADAVIRLPDGLAIEAIILHAVSEASIRQTLNEICSAMSLPLITGLDNMSGNELKAQVIKFIKRNSLHSAFIETLPSNDLPSLAITLLERTILAGRGQLTGVVQL